jgi:hypothetical protein
MGKGKALGCEEDKEVTKSVYPRAVYLLSTYTTNGFLADRQIYTPHICLRIPVFNLEHQDKANATTVIHISHRILTLHVQYVCKLVGHNNR